MLSWIRKARSALICHSPEIPGLTVSLYDEASVHIEKALALNPNCPPAYLGHRGNTYRLTASGDLDAVASVAGVESVVGLDESGEGRVRLILGSEVAGSDVLRGLIERVDVHEFVSEEPDLETIFIKAVQDAR